MTTSNKKMAKHIAEIAKQEFKAMLKEAAEKESAESNIGKKLEELRKKLEKDMVCVESLGNETFGGQRTQKRLQMATVSELLEIPINELTMYFLNNVKATNERHLVEMHLNFAYFFKE